MFTEFFFFELKYRFARKITYIYFVLIFVLSFLIVTSPTLKIAGAVGQTAANSPYTIALLQSILSFVFTIITSAFISVAIIRDFEHNTSGIIFTTPLSKFGYLFGRFSGSVVIVILVQTAISFGFMAGFAVGEYLPWDVAWINRKLLPFNLLHFVQPFLLFTVTNIFITGALFFSSGSLGRRPLFIYMQGVLLVIVYQIGYNLMGNLRMEKWVAILDPFGVNTFQFVTRYWTPVEQNAMLISLDGTFLVNRIIWIALGLLSLLFTYFRFSFHKKSLAFSTPGKEKKMSVLPNAISLIIPKVRKTINLKTYWVQFTRLTLDHFRMIWKERPFLIIMASGALVIIANALKITSVYGTPIYPTTSEILSLLGSFNLFFIIIMIFYSGELIWKERSSKVNLIVDSLPVPTGINLFAKICSITLIYISLFILLTLSGITIQIIQGYYEFELSAYFYTLYVDRLTSLFLFTVLVFFIQIVINNRYMGFAVCILVVVFRSYMGRLGIESGLLQYAGGSLGIFSEMNLYGHFVEPFTWLRTYWSAFAGSLTAICVLFYLRGYDNSLGSRLKVAVSRVKGPIMVFSLISLIVFILSGFYIRYNVSRLNRFDHSDNLKSWKAEYEVKLKKFQYLNQPKIINTVLNVSINPASRDFIIDGNYTLINNSSHVINEVHISKSSDPNILIEKVSFDKDFSLVKKHDNLGFAIYQLAQPLLPGASMNMGFRVSFITKGFVNGATNLDIVYNGTFISNDYLPGLGYNSAVELTEKDDREDFNLPKLQLTSSGNNKQIGIFGNDADMINLDITVSTSSDQLVVGPGKLKAKWSEGSKLFYHYVTTRPISNYYAIVSGNYKVIEDNWKGVNLEIYYHPEHLNNVGGMMMALKESMNYYTSNFGSYQNDNLRIVELPRYKSHAQSLATTITFSEAIEFVSRVKDRNIDLDIVSFVTANETASQWWKHNISIADTQGMKLISEGIGRYSSLMVLQNSYPGQTLEKYLEYELDAYLRGRSMDRKKEQPLYLVENDQAYVYSHKAALIFHALQDYLGEKKLNDALREFRENWQSGSVRYATSIDLINEIRKIVPDSLNNLIDDYFFNITLFNNSISDGAYKKNPDGSFEVTMNLQAHKLVLDSLGNEIEVPINDWIDVGVYGKDISGQDSLIYLRKYKFSNSAEILSISVNRLPTIAGIDPLKKLIDQHPNNNKVKLKEFIDVSNLFIGF